MKAFILFFALSVLPSYGAEVKYPGKVELEGHTYLLRGWGYRTATWFKVKVYHCGLYQEKLELDPLKEGGSLMDLTFTHDVGAEDQRKAWKIAVEKNCKKPCTVPVGELNRYLQAQVDVKEGDKFRYVFGEKSVVIYPPHGESATYSRNFGLILLSTWLGNSPPTEQLKRALLGAKP